MAPENRPNTRQERSDRVERRQQYSKQGMATTLPSLSAPSLPTANSEPALATGPYATRLHVYRPGRTETELKHVRGELSEAHHAIQRARGQEMVWQKREDDWKQEMRTKMQREALLMSKLEKEKQKRLKRKTLEDELTQMKEELIRMQGLLVAERRTRGQDASVEAEGAQRRAAERAIEQEKHVRHLVTIAVRSTQARDGTWLAGMVCYVRLRSLP